MSPKTYRQFTTRQLIVITFICCLVFAGISWMGLEAATTLSAVLSIGAPCGSFVAACYPENASLGKRIMIGTVFALSILLVASGLLLALAGPGPVVVYWIALSVLWTGQFLYLFVLFRVWKSGMKSAQRGQATLVPAPSGADDEPSITANPSSDQC